jgi:Protein of unknown function (DUF2911)
LKYYLSAAVLTVFTFCLCLVTAPVANAQIKASERASLSQTIDGTQFEIEYSRPSKRDRDPIFGGFVHWGEVWTPGANQATTISFDKDIEIEGVSVPEGSYSLWMAVRENDDWELALSENDSLFHVPHLDIETAFVRIPIRPAKHASKMETLTFYFPTITSTGGTLRMHWGETFVDMSIKVPSTQRLTLTEEEVGPFLGTYETHMAGNPAQNQPEVNSNVTFELHGDIAWGTIDLGFPEPVEIGLALVSENVFHPMMIINGEPATVFSNMFVEFEVDDDGATTGFEIRFINDDLWITGTRK